MAREVQGNAETKWFDITDYEGSQEGNRRDKSPMLSFLLLDSRLITRPATKYFFTIDLFENWLRAKRRTCHCFITLWFLLRVFNVMTFVTFDLGIFTIGDVVEKEVWDSTLNRTTLVHLSAGDANHCRGNFVPSAVFRRLIVWLIFLQSSCQLIFDLVEFAFAFYQYRRSWHRWTELGKKRLAVQILFYRIMQFLAEFAMCIGTLTSLFPIIDSTLVQDLIYIQVSFGITWSLMYFLQLAPWIGRMVVTVQRMINDLFKYSFLHGLFLVTFAHSFLRLVAHDNNRTGKCSEEFSTVLHSWYRSVAVKTGNTFQSYLT